MSPDGLAIQVARGAASVADLCKEFVNGGSCPRGQACKYVHPHPEDVSAVRCLWLSARKQEKQARSHMLGDPHAFDSLKKSQRAAELAKWIVQTYGREWLNGGSGVLDVAGGRGELSFELQHVHQVQVSLVEPRPWAAWKLSKRQRGILKARGLPWKQVSLTQLQTHFTDELPDALMQVVQDCSLLVGLHPDQATEPILQHAMRLQKPFCIVPCCVFPGQHPDRKIRLPDGSLAPVLTHEDLVVYLRQAGEAETARLPFMGRNVVVYRRADPGLQPDTGAG
eukprot:jgi/Ulvmu1/7480/UM037_0023.1